MFEISFPSRIEYLTLVDAVCQAFCTWIGLPKKVAEDISIAAIEASTNAVLHGNRCEESKRVRVTFNKSRREIKLCVIDEGTGFDPEKIPNPVDAANLLKECGRGIYIMRQVMDKVDFGFPKGGGTRVEMTKRVVSRRKGRILSIDYGERRLGMALSDELCITAQPFGKIEACKGKDPIEEILRIVVDYDVKEIVVGMPITLRGEISASASRVTEFATKLNQQSGIPVITWDERFSTKQGEQILIQSGMRRKKRKHVIDSVAATVILQCYLDSRGER